MRKLKNNTNNLYITYLKFFTCKYYSLYIATCHNISKQFIRKIWGILDCRFNINTYIKCLNIL